jgi:hypothetical protein
MTRSQAKQVIIDALVARELKEVVAENILSGLDEALVFESEIAEMSAVCRGVARLSNEE